ncbi:calcium-translocating P-type ATPase, PMCA-type [Batrachochytrium salamandrivorans]|nr:calcium-translocating P-type ATPase, PMCA-type [Batrachochytrium salamandrivorans]
MSSAKISSPKQLPNRAQSGKFTAHRLAQLVHELQESEQHPETDLEAILEFPQLVSSLVGRPLGECANGLDSSLLESRRLEYGSNEIPLPSIPTYFELVMEGFNDPTLQILLASAVISIALSVVNGENGVEGVSVLLTVLIVVNVTAMTNYDKAKEFRKQQLEVDSEKSVWVIRDGGVMSQVHPNSIVVGDVFRVQVGSVCPADALMLSTGAELLLDESALTGESHLIPKRYKSVLISGTSVMRGEGICVAIAVGPLSVSGRIFSLILQEHEEGGNSVLFEKLDNLAVQVGRIGMMCSLLVFVNLVGHWILFNENKANETWGEWITAILGFFISSVTVLVVAVPEGLPLAVTLALSVSLGRLLEDQNQVKSMESCETMGSATTICSDKTGTLTENRMTVVDVSNDMEQDLLVKCLALCASPETTVAKSSDGHTYAGNATECALLRYCNEVLEVDPIAVQRKFADPNVPDLKWGLHSNPFSSERKMMSLAIRLPETNEVMLLVKGAPQVILENCDGVSAQERQTIQAEWKGQEDNARRVLALAVRRNITNSFAETNLTYLGWLALEDPLRAHVTESIISCQKAGVVIRMVTGDSLPTAVAIARQCRILSSSQHTFMTGAEFMERVCVKDYAAERTKRRCFDFEQNCDTVQLAQPFLSEGLRKVIDQEAFDEIWPNLRVVARCEPEDKLVLVSGLKNSELHLTDPRVLPQVVAVTGDGTNDAPALKASDVGFAMNIGTDVAKQAADIILLNGSFNSIVRALIWGRNVHDSVCKFLQFQMTVNLSALVLTVIGALLTTRTPMTATQMLWVNLIMDSIGSFALATLYPDEEVLLSRPPIPRDAKVISVRMMVNIIGQALFQLSYLLFMLLVSKRYTQDSEQVFYTKFFTTFVLLQLANELNCCTVNGSSSERWNTTAKFRYVWLLTLTIQIIIVQYGGQVFSCVPLNLADWLECLNAAFWCIPWQLVVVDPFAHWVEKTVKLSEDKHETQGLLHGSPTLSYGSTYTNGGEDHRRSRSGSKRRWSLLRNTVAFVNAVSGHEMMATPSSPILLGQHHPPHEHVITRVLRSGSITSDAQMHYEHRHERSGSLDGGRRNSIHDARDNGML